MPFTLNVTFCFLLPVLFLRMLSLTLWIFCYFSKYHCSPYVCLPPCIWPPHLLNSSTVAFFFLFSIMFLQVAAEIDSLPALRGRILQILLKCPSSLLLSLFGTVFICETKNPKRGIQILPYHLMKGLPRISDNTPTTFIQITH